MLYALGGLERLWFWGSVAAGHVVIASGALLLRRYKRIVIGDTWMTGPSFGSFEPTTILFDTLDVAGSGIRKGEVQIRSLSGREIAVKVAWYAPADIEEIQRLVCDRTVGSGAEGALLPRIG